LPGGGGGDKASWEKRGRDVSERKIEITNMKEAEGGEAGDSKKGR
jgi:hypothetical protein